MTTPVREINGYWIQLCGPRTLVLHKFDRRCAQNKDGTGYNLFDNLRNIKVFKNEWRHTTYEFAWKQLVEYMEHYKIKIAKDNCIIDLPEHLYK